MGIKGKTSKTQEVNEINIKSYIPFEFYIGITFFVVYAIISFLGGLGFEQDTYSHVTLTQEIIGYRVSLPFFGREYVWLPFYHYLGASLVLLSGKLVFPVYILRLLSAFCSSFVLILIYRWLRQIGVSPLFRVISVLLIGLNAYWFAYSTMSMTDIFSISLLVGWFYLIDKFLKQHQNKYLAIASVLALMGVSTRFEAWIFMSISTLFIFLWANRNADLFIRIKKNIISCLIFSVPAVVFIGFWFLYCYLGKGDPLYFTHDPTKFLWGSSLFYNNISLSLQELVKNLLLVSGIMWIFPFIQVWRGKNKPLFTHFSLLMVLYLVFLVFQLYQGVNAGFVRYWLPFLPLSSIAFGVTASENKSKWFIIFYVIVLASSIAFSVIGINQILSDHSSYIETFGTDEGRL